MPKPSEPVFDAPPPLFAVCTNAAIGAVGLYFLPSLQDVDEMLDSGDIFLQRVFPEQVSVRLLLSIRILYALVCFYVPIVAVSFGNIVVQPTYLPASKLPRTILVVNGIKLLFSFTSWAWNLLGIHFALSAYITHRLDSGMSAPVWMMRLALVLWETVAPATLMVSAVVKYAIWPTALKTGRDTSVLKGHRGLLQHNANVFMAFTELCLMGGLPIRLRHSCFPLLLGVTYVFFTWAIRNVWSPKTGTAFIYFFMDTTLGAARATFSLVALTSAMQVFYGIFWLVADFSQKNESGLTHVVLVVAVFFLVARFRD